MVRVLVHFVFTAAHFHLALVAGSISYFLTAATKLSCSSNKKMSPLLFICRSSRWAVLAYCLVSLILCPSLALFSKLVDMTINLSLILQTTRIQKQFPLSVFIFIDSLVVSALQHSGGYAISRQPRHKNNLFIYTFSCCLNFTLLCLFYVSIILIYVLYCHD